MKRKILIFFLLTLVYSLKAQIYVGNKKDIRYILYKDSLNLYNSYIAKKKRLISEGYAFAHHGYNAERYGDIDNIKNEKIRKNALKKEKKVDVLNTSTKIKPLGVEAWISQSTGVEIVGDYMIEHHNVEPLYNYSNAKPKVVVKINTSLVKLKTRNVYLDDSFKYVQLCNPTPCNCEVVNKWIPFSESMSALGRMSGMEKINKLICN